MDSRPCRSGDRTSACQDRQRTTYDIDLCALTDGPGLVSEAEIPDSRRANLGAGSEKSRLLLDWIIAPSHKDGLPYCLRSITRTTPAIAGEGALDAGREKYACDELAMF